MHKSQGRPAPRHRERPHVYTRCAQLISKHRRPRVREDKSRIARGAYVSVQPLHISGLVNFSEARGERTAFAHDCQLKYAHRRRTFVLYIRFPRVVTAAAWIKEIQSPRQSNFTKSLASLMKKKYALFYTPARVIEAPSNYDDFVLGLYQPRGVFDYSCVLCAF